MHKRFKESQGDVKDDSRSVKPSTSKTEVNIVQIRQLICGDRQSIVRMITTRLDMKKDSDYLRTFWQIWKVTGWEEHHRTGTTSVLAKSCSGWLFSVLQDFAQCDFFLFPKIEGIINLIHLEGVEAIQRAVTTELKGIQKEFFQECVQMWKRKMGKWIRFEEDFFKEKNI